MLRVCYLKGEGDGSKRKKEYVAVKECGRVGNGKCMDGQKQPTREFHRLTLTAYFVAGIVYCKPKGP